MRRRNKPLNIFWCPLRYILEKEVRNITQPSDVGLWTLLTLRKRFVLWYLFKILILLCLILAKFVTVGFLSVNRLNPLLPTEP